MYLSVIDWLVILAIIIVGFDHSSVTEASGRHAQKSAVLSIGNGVY